MTERMIEELEEQLDAIAICIRSEGLPTFLQGAWPDLPDILTDAATQLRRLRKISEDAPGGPFRSEPHDETRWRVICDTDPAEDNEHFYGSKDECDGVRDVLNHLKTNDQT